VDGGKLLCSPSLRKDHDGDNELLVTILREELDARRREVQEPHVLQTAQAALGAPERRSWWRWWK